MNFNENTLEQAFIELLNDVNIPHYNGTHIHKEISEVILREDLQTYLLNQYSDEDITLNEIRSIIRQLEVLPSSALYESNKAIMKMIADGFVLKREDRNQKDLFIHLIDFKSLVHLESLSVVHDVAIAAETEVVYGAAKTITFIVLSINLKFKVTKIGFLMALYISTVCLWLS